MTLIEAQPHSGYTHQIRAHLASVGFPIIADRLYQRDSQVLLDQQEKLPTFNRLALHALSITFLHPAKQIEMKIDAPYPVDFLNAINQIK